MSRRMSVSMTLDAVRNRTKTVTRLHVNAWKWTNLKPGDRLNLIENDAFDLGAKQVVVAKVEIVDVRVERLGKAGFGEIHSEGLWLEACRQMEETGIHPIVWFRQFWCDGHGYRGLGPVEQSLVPCRRIEWRYLYKPAEATR